MTLLARRITDGICLDTNAKLDADLARKLRGAGVTSVWRYVSLGPPRPGDLDAGELELLLSAGLTVLVVQHVRLPGWHASSDQGDEDGQVATANAQKAGYASAGGLLSLSLDMEGVRDGDAAGHARAWCAAVRAGGYAPVVYVGYDSQLTGAQLDALGSDVAFWSDFAPLTSRPRPSRGYALHQQPQSVLCGVGVDVDLVLQPGVLRGLADGDCAAGDPGDPVAGGPDEAA